MCRSRRRPCFPRVLPDSPSHQRLSHPRARRYHFRCLKLLKLALLHHSVSEAASNALSWVGDTVLQTVITEQLALHRQGFSVAKLSPIRSVLVSRTVLARQEPPSLGRLAAPLPCAVELRSSVCSLLVSCAAPAGRPSCQWGLVWWDCSCEQVWRPGRPLALLSGVC